MPEVVCISNVDDIRTDLWSRHSGSAGVDNEEMLGSCDSTDNGEDCTEESDEPEVSSSDQWPCHGLDQDIETAHGAQA